MFNKTTKHLFVWLGLTLALAVSVTVAQDLPCNVAYKCTSDGPGVWATDNERCYVFPNNCQLDNENCQRQNRYQEELTVVPKEECQKLCLLCLQVFRPVCGVYNGKYRTFGNRCTLENYVCSTGEFYTFAHNGEC